MLLRAGTSISASIGMTLTGTLPGGSVGVYFSGSLTLGGRFTAPVNITASSGTIPAWMTVSVVGNQVNFFGTPTTAETESFTVKATDSSATPQTATSPQSVVIGAAPTGPTIVQFVPVGVAAGNSAAFNIASGWNTPTSGNLLLMQASLGNASTFVPDSSWSVINDTPSGAVRDVFSYCKFSDGTESSMTFATNIVSMCEITGVDSDTPVMQFVGQSLASSSTQPIPTETPIVPGSLAIGSATWNLAGTFTATVSSGWTQQPPNNFVSYDNLFCAVQQQSNSPAPVNCTFTNTGAGTCMTATMFVSPASNQTGPFVIRGTLPAATVYQPYSANLYMGGAFEAPVTIDASSGAIPSWMSVQITGEVLTFSGTPQNPETDTFTVRATDANSQIATSPQTVDVTIAEEAIGVVQGNSSTVANGGSISVTLPSAPIPNHILVAHMCCASNGTTTAPTGWNVIEAGGASQATVRSYWKLSDGSEQTTTFAKTDTNAASLSIIELQGVDPAAPIHMHSSVDVTSAVTPAVADYPTLTPSIPNTLAIGAIGWQSGGSMTSSYGWEPQASKEVNYYGLGVTSSQQDAQLGAVSGVVSTAATGTDGTATLLILRPGEQQTAGAMTLTGSLPAAMVGAPYHGTLTVAGTYTSPITLDAESGSIPAWATPLISGNTILFQGTPTSAGTLTFTPRITDSTPGTPQTATAPQSFPVSDPSSIAAGSILAIGTVGGTFISVTAASGQRVPMVSGNINMGSLKFHSDGLCAQLENCYAGITRSPATDAADITGNFVIATQSGEIIFNDNITIWAYSRSRPFWLTNPTPIASPDLTGFLQYGTSSGSPSMYTAYILANNTAMGEGCTSTDIGQVGAQPNLGPLPKWDASWMVNPTADNLIVVRGMSDASSPWSFHCVDPGTNEMINIQTYPKATMLRAQLGQTGNPCVPYATNTYLDLEQVQDHATNYNALANALYGTAYDQEEIGFWCNYCNSLTNGSEGRLSVGCDNSGGITRAQGRGLTVMLYAAKYCNTIPGYFVSWVNAYIADCNSRYPTQAGAQISQYQGGYPNYGIAPWQQHYFTRALGLAIKHGYTAAQTSFDYFAISLLDSILVTQHEFATLYELSIWDSVGNLAQDWAQMLQYSANYAMTTGTVLEISGANASVPILAHKEVSQTSNASPSVATYPTLTPTVANTLAIGASVWAANGATMTSSSGWILQSSGELGYNTSGVATQAQGGSLAPVTGTMSMSAIGVSGSASLLLVNPSGGSAPSVVQNASAQSLVGAPVFSLAAPTAGNLLVIHLGASIGAGSPTPPANWNKVETGSKNPATILSYWKISDGTETSIAFTNTTRNANYATALPLAEGTQALLDALGDTVAKGYQAGDFNGEPWSSQGYPAYMQGALAMLKEYATDQTRAQAAWQKFSDNYLTTRPTVYENDPTYNVLS